MRTTRQRLNVVSRVRILLDAGCKSIRKVATSLFLIAQRIIQRPDNWEKQSLLFETTKGSERQGDGDKGVQRDASV